MILKSVQANWSQSTLLWLRLVLDTRHSLNTERVFSICRQKRIVRRSSQILVTDVLFNEMSQCSFPYILHCCHVCVWFSYGSFFITRLTIWMHKLFSPFTLCTWSDFNNFFEKELETLDVEITKINARRSGCQDKAVRGFYTSGICSHDMKCLSRF